MMISAILKDRTLKDKLKSEFRKPDFALKTFIKSPPLSNNYALIGTATDYIIVLAIERFNNKKVISDRDLESDRLYNNMIDRLNSLKTKKFGP